MAREDSTLRQNEVELHGDASVADRSPACTLCTSILLVIAAVNCAGCGILVFKESANVVKSTYKPPGTTVDAGPLPHSRLSGPSVGAVGCARFQTTWNATP